MEYLQREFGERVADAYEATVWESLDRIATLPQSCPLLDGERDTGLHKCMLHPKSILLYRVVGDTLWVEAVVSSRTNWL